MKVARLISFSGIKTAPERFINMAFAVSLIIGILFAFITWFYYPQLIILIFIGVFIGIFCMFNGFLIIAVDRRTNFVETILPDALELTAANIRSGFIPSKALLLSARSEFGPLSEAIKLSGKEIMTGKSLEDGLKVITRHIKSETLERTIQLITEGSRSGGQLVTLLEENAADIRRRQSIKKEVKANIVMYGIFIVFAACIGAPVLYSLSSYLIVTLTKFGALSSVPIELSRNVPFFRFGIKISADFIFFFSIASIIITTFFSGLIIGLIDTGSEKGGIKYIPILVAIGLLIFFGASIFINSMFVGMVPG